MAIDEDGCCSTCGSNAVGDGAELALSYRKTLTSALAALRNVQMLAKRIRARKRAADVENAEHLLRFCESAGVVESPLDILRADKIAT